MSNETNGAARSNGSTTGPGRPPVEHQFKAGNPGRPVGSRNKLGEEFLKDMLSAWQADGIDAIRRVIAERPQDFLKVVASILPKEVQAEVTHRFVARLPEPVRTTEEWQRQHSPTAMQ